MTDAPTEPPCKCRQNAYHPILLFLLGCLLLSSCQAGCAISTYYDHLDDQLKRSGAR